MAEIVDPNHGFVLPLSISTNVTLYFSTCSSDWGCNEVVLYFFNVLDFTIYFIHDLRLEFTSLIGMYLMRDPKIAHKSSH